MGRSPHSSQDLRLPFLLQEASSLSLPVIGSLSLCVRLILCAFYQIGLPHFEGVDSLLDSFKVALVFLEIVLKRKHSEHFPVGNSDNAEPLLRAILRTRPERLRYQPAAQQGIFFGKKEFFMNSWKDATWFSEWLELARKCGP